MNKYSLIRIICTYGAAAYDDKKLSSSSHETRGASKFPHRGAAISGTKKGPAWGPGWRIVRHGRAWLVKISRWQRGAFCGGRGVFGLSLPLPPHPQSRKNLVQEKAPVPVAVRRGVTASPERKGRRQAAPSGAACLCKARRKGEPEGPSQKTAARRTGAHAGTGMGC